MESILYLDLIKINVGVVSERKYTSLTNHKKLLGCLTNVSDKLK